MSLGTRAIGNSTRRSRTLSLSQPLRSDRAVCLRCVPGSGGEQVQAAASTTLGFVVDETAGAGESHRDQSALSGRGSAG